MVACYSHSHFRRCLTPAQTRPRRRAGLEHPGSRTLHHHHRLRWDSASSSAKRCSGAAGVEVGDWAAVALLLLRRPWSGCRRVVGAGPGPFARFRRREKGMRRRRCAEGVGGGLRWRDRLCRRGRGVVGARVLARPPLDGRIV